MILKVIGINLLVFAFYGLLIVFSTAAANRGFTIAIGMGFCIFIQVVLNALTCLVFFIIGKREWGQSFLISAAVLAPVGFVTWLILLSIYG